MSTTQITVKHNFETAHRLPFLGGKCDSLHGHSWWVTFTIYNMQEDMNGGVDVNGIAAEYGNVKKVIREWIDRYLDHGSMLGKNDLLVKQNAPLGKVFIFGEGIVHGYMNKPWPTVEAVAEMLCMKVQQTLDEVFQGLFIDRVELQETHVNGVVYIQGV